MNGILGGFFFYVLLFQYIDDKPSLIFLYELNDFCLPSKNKNNIYYMQMKSLLGLRK
jgi:hypothetical protein